MITFAIRTALIFTVLTQIAAAQNLSVKWKELTAADFVKAWTKVMTLDRFDLQ